MVNGYFDLELAADRYEQEMIDREIPFDDEEPQKMITPDKEMAKKLSRAFNRLGFHKPDSLISWHKRAAFVKALNICGINFHIDYCALGGPRLFIDDAQGKWIDIYAA